MTLMILEILSLEDVISRMEVTICPNVWLPSATRRSTSAIMAAADCEFSAFLRVMDVISSLDAEVSSSDAACSEAPCASDWLEEATCEEALAICSAPSESSVTVFRSDRFRPRMITKAAPPPHTEHSASRLTSDQNALP